MKMRIFLIGAVLLAPIVAFAQGSAAFREKKVVPTPRGEWTGSRLPDGQPDIQGFWSNTIGNHNNLTDPNGGVGEEDAPARGQGGGNGGGGRGGARSGAQAERAPSRISDPPDGQIPLQGWAREKQLEFKTFLNNPIKQEYVEPFALCAPGGPSKSFMWHGYEIRQYPDYVVFLFGSGNRIIYLDGRPHLPANLKLWNGDSRGHWEGNTLVVDTTNNNSKARFSRTGEFVSEHATVQETFVFDNKGDRFTYNGTYTDPTVLTRPFTITIPNKRVTADTPADDWNNETFPAKHAGSEPLIEDYEKICMEGNGNHGHVAAAGN